MALVDTIDEQQILEQLLDASKPPIPPDCRQFHYLLATPFRYGAAYPAGSRFRRAGLTPGVFYASQTVATAVAEMAFRRLLFYAESPQTPWPANASEYTAFAVRFRTGRAWISPRRRSIGSVRGGRIPTITLCARRWRMPRVPPACRRCVTNRRARPAATSRC